MIINVLIISLKLKYKFTTTHNVDHRSLISLLEFQQFVFGFSEEFIFFDAVRADAISIESRCTVAVCPASNFQALIRSEWITFRSQHCSIQRDFLVHVALKCLSSLFIVQIHPLTMDATAPVFVASVIRIYPLTDFMNCQFLVLGVFSFSGLAHPHLPLPSTISLLIDILPFFHCDAHYRAPIIKHFALRNLFIFSDTKTQKSNSHVEWSKQSNRELCTMMNKKKRFASLEAGPTSFDALTRNCLFFLFWWEPPILAGLIWKLWRAVLFFSWSDCDSLNFLSWKRSSWQIFCVKVFFACTID